MEKECRLVISRDEGGEEWKVSDQLVLVFFWDNEYVLEQDSADRDFSEIGTSLTVQWLRLQVPTAGDAGSIPGWGTKIAQATEQLSLHTATSEPTYHN